MKVILYSRFDKTGNFYNPVQCANTDNIQTFLEENRRSCIRLNDPAKLAYIKDLSIVHLGYFDDETCKIDLLPEPVTLIDCVHWLGGEKHE